ncbi:glycosyltransferase 87 family protein [Mesorhizobium sp. MSK_1335]|uniref:Glycosyltransferase 87 family protein n=1 Tax=Mesorhizobium montanum TaxID=3072323 RepID=A0ABU4ZRV5_9HYPH|nr:glycosyltransferase 87 family protein [Mesorhizobium sp. MSK_1335]MDX8528139.1 glycosyltransferase 87 family protein [Mesorhizobium sp. MSK_1335]
MTITKPVFDRLGFWLWVGAFLVVLGLALWSPNARSVVHIYKHGSEAFLSRQPLYQVEVAMGYLYAPAFAVLYVPLLKLGPYLGKLLWHMLGFGALTFAAMRQVRKLGGHEQTWLLSVGLFLALPVALAALRNGQATVLLTGACWFLTLSALEGRRSESFFWATLAIIAKPTAIIMLLLAGALRPRLIPALVLAVLVVLAIPYGFASTDYINAQYHDFFRMLTSMTIDPTGPFVPADFTAPFTRLGMTVPELDATIVRVVAGLLTLWLVLQFDRRLDPNISGLAIFLTAAFYMCVFNPRVEQNTYAMVSVPAGLSIALLWREKGAATVRWLLATLLFATGLTSIDSRLHDLFHPWLRPISISIIACVLIGWFWTRGRQKMPTAGAVAHG